MARPIDEKLVVMKLDNSDFKRKAVETTGLFGSLKDSLNKIPGVNLGKTTRELGAISKQAGNMNVNSLANSVQTVASKFTALNVVAITALTNITNKAVNAGLALTKSLTLDQVTAGFAEYELKMGSIQTILANTQKHGTGLKDVSSALSELNDYADKTVYNFADMTKNIGLFTNSGLKLEESVSMIKGFSNAAAASGTDAQGAAHAAYQLSQALSTGTIRLMDWRSLTNVGMGNKNMQEGLVDIATAMGAFNGTGIDGKIVLEDFNSSLEKNWLSADVMSKYLQIMAKDMDATEMAALGLTDSQIKLFQQQANTAEEAATKVRTFTALMDTLKEAIGSGWATTFELIFGDFDEATKLWTTLSDALNGVVSQSADARNALLKGVADGGGFDNIFEGLQNASKPLIQIFGAVREGFQKVFPPVTVERVLQITESFKKFTAGLTLSRESVLKLTNIFQGVFSIFSTAWEITKRLTAAFVNLIPEGAGSGLLDLVEKVALLATGFNESVKQGNGLTAFIDGLGRVLGQVGNWLGDIVGYTVAFASGLRSNVGGAIDWLKEKLAPLGNWLKDAFAGFGMEEVMGGGVLIGIGLLVKKVMGLIDNFTGIFDGASDSFGGIKDLFGNLGGALESFQQQVKYSNLVKIAVAIGILALSLKLLEGMDGADIAKGLTALGTSLGLMMTGLMIMDKMSITGGVLASASLVTLSIAVLIMASALKKISDLNPKELITGIAGLVGITTSLSIAVIAMSKLGGKIGTSSVSLLALAGTIYILAGAVEKMSKIKASSLIKSVGALGIIFTQLAIFLKVVDRSKLGVSSAVGLVMVSGAIHIMVSAISKIADIDTKSLAKGLGTIGIILAEIALFSKVAQGPMLMAAGVGLLLMAGAINALMGPIQTFAGMSLVELAKGLGGMALAFVAIAGAAALMQSSVLGAATMILMATALNLLLIPIKQFAGMSWGELVKGFVGLAGGLTVIALASMLLTPAVIPMLAFGGALLVMGLAILAAGVGIGAFGAGLAALAGLTATSVAAIIAALGMLITGLGTLIVDVVQFVVQLGLALVDGLVKLIPAVAEGALKLVVSILEAITKNLPRILELGVKIVTQLMDGIAKEGPKLTQSAINLMLSLIESLTNAIKTDGPKITNAFMTLMGEVLILFIDAGIKVINALFGWIPGVTDATSTIGKVAESTIRKNFGAQEAGTDKGKEFATSLGGTTGDASKSGKAIGEAGKTGAAGVDLKSTGINAGIGFANGMGSSDVMSKVTTVAKGLASAAKNMIAKVLDMHSPSRVTHEQGVNTGVGFANGMKATKKKVGKTAAQVATEAKKNFKSAMDKTKFDFKMGKIDSAKHIAEIEKLKKSYSKYPELVRTAEAEIKKVRDKNGKDLEAARKKQYDNEKKNISDRKAYSNLTMRQELTLWESIQKKYKKGSEERKEADLEVYKLKLELLKKDISERKYYNDLSLMDELNAWRKIHQQYKAGTDERIAAEHEIYRIKNEINKKLIAENENYVAKVQDANQKLIDGIKALNEEYENTVKNRADELSGFAGMFEHVTDQGAAPGWVLVENIESQVKVLETWMGNMDKLSKTDIDLGLLEALRNMGPKSAAEINSLVNMTEEQLKRYSDVWVKKNELATQSATDQYEQLKQDTATKIDEMTKETEKQLEEYKKEWIDNITEIKEGVKDQYVGLKDSMTGIGADSIKGLMAGISAMEGPLMAQAKALADAISATIRSALDINSPSKVLTRDGENAGEGVVVGLANKTKDVAKSAKGLAMAAKDTLNNFLEGFELPEEDSELRFKAVIDYDDFDPNKFGDLNQKALDTTFTNKTAMETSAKRIEGQNGNNTSTTDNSKRTTINVESGPTGREIARETERAMRRLEFELGV